MSEKLLYVVLAFMTAATPAHAESGIASSYSRPQPTASGQWFRPHLMTAAHPRLPMGTRVRVTHRKTGRSVVVRINDRGPYVRGRIIDLSRAAARRIGITARAGIGPVTVRVLP